MIFVLDNYDSFTFNLVQYLAQLGAEVRVARNDQCTVDEIMAKGPAGIVISPGPGRPAGAGIASELVEAARSRLPVLGVCLGHQVIAGVYGGRIVAAPSPFHGKLSTIQVTQDCQLFAGLPASFQATRYHSLAVELPADCRLQVNASVVGEPELIMAVSCEEDQVYGVQFHPESWLTPLGPRILANFMTICEQSFDARQLEIMNSRGTAQ